MGALLQCPLSRHKIVNNNNNNRSLCPRSAYVHLNLTKREKRLLQRHWEATVLAQEPNLFWKVMLKTIEDCPRLLDVITSKRLYPKMENIADCPKLKRMANGNCAFFTKQITVNELDETLVRQDSEKLGSIHIQYAPHGFKPTFLDIWQSNMIALIELTTFRKDSEKTAFVKAFKTLSSFLCNLMIMEYEDSMQLIRHMEKEYKKFENVADMLS